MNKIDKSFVIVLLLCGIIIGICVTGMLLNYSLTNMYELSINNIQSHFKKSIPIPQNETDIVDACQNLSLIKTSYCYKNQIKTFYKYKITPDAIHLSLKELEDKGGDCLNYARLYKRLGDKQNFYTEIVHIQTDNNIDHAFTVFSNNDSYCVLDQLNVQCVNLE